VTLDREPSLFYCSAGYDLRIIFRLGKYADLDTLDSFLTYIKRVLFWFYALCESGIKRPNQILSLLTHLKLLNTF